LSYGRKYKDYLFSHETFVEHFQKWFVHHGEAELSKKCRTGSDLWFVFFDYASKELFHYRPMSQLDSHSTDPGSTATELLGGIEDFEMHIMEDDRFVSMVLDRL
jgi:hypothetical protein